MAAWTVVLRMNVDDYKYARKIRKAIKKMHGVRSVWASPEQGLVEVYGKVDAYALKQRILRKLNRHASIVSDGSAPYYYPETAAQPYYGQSSQPAYGYYSHQSPAGSYPYYATGRGYGGAGWSNRDPYGYAAHSTVPTCSIL